MQASLVINEVEAIRKAENGVGTRSLHRRLQPLLKDHDIKLGRDKLFDLLAAHQLLIRRRRRKKVYTTDSNHPFRKYANLIKDLTVKAANQVWVSDITYLALKGGKFCYLSLVTDVYSRKIVGYHLYPTLHSEGTILALKMALATRNKSVFYKTIHHSDRGIQYCCKEYTATLIQNEILISMTQKGDPGENAIAERVNGILKTQLQLATTFDNFKLATQAVNQAVDIYNRKRLHSSCDYLTPDQAYLKASGILKKHWKAPTKRGVNLQQDYS